MNTETGSTGGIQIQELIRADETWNGTSYRVYPEGAAEPVVAKITIPAHKELTWLIFYSLGMPSGRKPLISLRAVVKYCEM